MRFLTPVYHPNIDTEGRICLDTLKMPPKGSWKPSVSISALMTTIRLLLSMPNPDDGLMPDIVSVGVVVVHALLLCIDVDVCATCRACV